MSLGDMAGVLVLVSVALTTGMILGLAGLGLLTWLDRVPRQHSEGDLLMATTHPGGRPVSSRSVGL